MPITPAQKVIAENMSEEELQNNIIRAANCFGWLVHAERPARLQNGEYRTALQGDKGFPDMVLAKADSSRIIFVECKSEKGRLTVEQGVWSMATYQHYYVWRPSAWVSGEIERILKGERDERE